MAHFAWAVQFLPGTDVLAPPFSSPSSPTGRTSHAPSPRLATGINSAIMKQRNVLAALNDFEGQVIRAIEELEGTP